MKRWPGSGRLALRFLPSLLFHAVDPVLPEPPNFVLQTTRFMKRLVHGLSRGLALGKIACDRVHVRLQFADGPKLGDRWKSLVAARGARARPRDAGRPDALRHATPRASVRHPGRDSHNRFTVAVLPRASQPATL